VSLAAQEKYACCKNRQGITRNTDNEHPGMPLIKIYDRKRNHQKTMDSTLNRACYSDLLLSRSGTIYQAVANLLDNFLISDTAA
jgi:hypothetical protein